MFPLREVARVLARAAQDRLAARGSDTDSSCCCRADHAERLASLWPQPEHRDAQVIEQYRRFRKTLVFSWTRWCSSFSQ